MARVFFTELAGKAKNPIYNLLPALLTRLSQSELGQGEVQEVLSFLLTFIGKERQVEGLVDKLTQRMGVGHLDELMEEGEEGEHQVQLRMTVDSAGEGAGGGGADEGGGCGQGSA